MPSKKTANKFCFCVLAPVERENIRRRVGHNISAKKNPWGGGGGGGGEKELFFLNKIKMVVVCVLLLFCWVVVVFF